MKRLFVLIAVMLVSVTVNINAADSDMKETAHWTQLLVSTSQPFGTAGPGVDYSYNFDTKGMVVCKQTTSYTALGVKTVTAVELTLYNSKNVVVGKGTLPSVVGTSTYYLLGVMNGKVAVIKEVAAFVFPAPIVSTVNTYQIMKDGTPLKCLTSTPLTGSYNFSPIPDATYTSEYMEFLCGVMVHMTTTYTWDPLTMIYTALTTQTRVYSKPDFKSCKIAGPGNLGYLHPPVVTKIWPLNNTVTTWDATSTTDVVDIAIVK